MAKLIRWIEAQPDISMPELAAKLKVEAKVVAHPASLSRALRKAGWIHRENRTLQGNSAKENSGVTPTNRAEPTL